jgi:nicotinic acid phosphoribosyltransferase
LLDGVNLLDSEANIVALNTPNLVKYLTNFFRRMHELIEVLVVVGVRHALHKFCKIAFNDGKIHYLNQIHLDFKFVGKVVEVVQCFNVLRFEVIEFTELKSIVFDYCDLVANFV